MIIQSGAQIALILLLDRFLGEDAPWYASLIACVVVLVYLCRFCNHLSKGLFRPYQENLLLLTGGKLSGEQVEAWKTGASGILTDKELELVEKEMLSPLIAAVPDGHSPNSSFTILERDDGKRAVILRYESKKDYIGADGGCRKWMLKMRRMFRRMNVSDRNSSGRAG